MGYVLYECLDASVPPASRCPSPPCKRSFLPKGCENPFAEGGDSREYVELEGTSNYLVMVTNFLDLPIKKAV